MTRAEKPAVPLSYLVSSRDTLPMIAKKLTGVSGKWVELYNHNRGIIGSNPSILPVGIVLNIPEGWL